MVWKRVVVEMGMDTDKGNALGDSSSTGTILSAAHGYVVSSFSPG
jgi:hypothetical protein